MDVVYRLGRATAADVEANLADSPSYSTVRTQLRVLETKGHLRHEDVGLRYVYAPTVSRAAARRAALRHLVEIFFEGSTSKVVAALLGADAADLTPDELDRIEALVADARKHTR